MFAKAAFVLEKYFLFVVSFELKLVGAHERCLRDSGCNYLQTPAILRPDADTT